MTIEFNIEFISREIKSHTHSYGQFVIPYAGAVYIC